jgi:hypothetical protein
LHITAPLIVIGILLFILLVLVLMLVSRSSAPRRPKPGKTDKTLNPEPPKPVRRHARSMEELLKVLQHKTSTTEELQDAIEEMARVYGKITPKLGIRAHPDFELYMLAIMLICRHRNTTKELVLGFDRELTRKNPEYKREINEAISKGLNARV